MYQVIRRVKDDEVLEYSKLYMVEAVVEGSKRLDEFTREEWEKLHDDLYVELAQKSLHLENIVVVDPYSLNIVVMYVGHSIIAVMIVACIMSAIVAYGLTLVTSNIVEVRKVIREIKPIAYAGFGTFALIVIFAGLFFLRRQN